MTASKDRPVPASISPLAQPAYRIELSLSVADAAALWDAARARGLAAPGACDEELGEVIGPREDPDLAACLSMLTAPAAIPGCDLADFEVTPLRAAPARAPANDFQLAARAGASA